MQQSPLKIIISRTDSIGDVVLTLPIAGVLKELYPDCKIFFLGKDYTRSVVESSVNIDEFVSWDDIKKLKGFEQIEKIKSLSADVIIHVFPVKKIAKLAKKANIPKRIGTTNRLYHWLYCNFIFILSRKNSKFHEAQLNLNLLKPLGFKKVLKLDEIPNYYGLKRINPLRDEFSYLLSKDKINLIIHPKSKGSAREWGLNNYKRLIEILPKDKYRVFITGTEEEKKIMESGEWRMENEGGVEVIDIMGKLNLSELISFINSADVLIAASTGPLHIAAALGKCAIGLYPPIRPMHPGRWAPIGKNTSYIVKNKKCNKCRNKMKCECLESITPEEVYKILNAKC